MKYVYGNEITRTEEENYRTPMPILLNLDGYYYACPKCFYEYNNTGSCEKCNMKLRILPKWLFRGGK